METQITVRLEGTEGWRVYKTLQQIEELTQGTIKRYWLEWDFLTIVISHEYLINWDNNDADIDHGETFEE